MQIDKEASRRWRRRLREVLLNEWDPIGIRDVPQAQDEYDAYVGKVAALLRDGATDEAISAYLHWIETEHMGLRRPDEPERLAKAVAAIRAVGYMN